MDDTRRARPPAHVNATPAPHFSARHQDQEAPHKPVQDCSVLRRHVDWMDRVAPVRGPFTLPRACHISDGGRLLLLSSRDGNRYVEID